MRYVKMCLMVTLLYILQITFFTRFKILHIVPNFVAVVVFCCSLLETNWLKAALFGGFCGLLSDAVSGAVFGLNCVLCIIFASLCCVLSVRFFKGKFLVCIIFSFVMSLLYESVFAIFGFVLWHEVAFSVCFIYKILPITLVNVLAAALLYVPIRKISGVEINN